VFLLLASGLLVVVIPGVLDGTDVAVFGERAPVPTFAPWSLPALDVTFSGPPTEGDGEIARWAAEQLANAVYALGVLVYYAGLAGVAVGAGLVGLALRQLARSADALGR
jgi:hypothetical protein